MSHRILLQLLVFKQLILAYLGFQRGPCAFTTSRECYSRWIKDDFHLENFCSAFSKSFEEIKMAQGYLQSCGYSLDRPEGWGYFYGKLSQGRDSSYISSDGHTAPKTEIMKSTEDQGQAESIDTIKEIRIGRVQMLTLTRKPGESIKIRNDSTSFLNIYYVNAVIYKLYRIC